MKRTSTILKGLLSFCVAFFAGHSSFAQLVGGDVYLQGQYAEVGISSCGKFGTESTAPPALGPYGVYHPNIGTTLGFVSDAGKNGWTTSGPTVGKVTGHPTGGTPSLPNFCGDYFRPGSPEEGFVVSVNGTNYINNGSSGCGGAMIPGTVTSYTNTGTTTVGVWTGNIAVPGGTVQVTATTTVYFDKTYFITRVSITNNSPNPVTDVYYMRTLDPDNDQPWTGDFTTWNRISHRPVTPAVSPTDCYANVESQGFSSATNWGCYLGLGAKDQRARAAYGGFTNTDPVAIWNATGGFTGGLGSAASGDIGNSLSFNIGTLAASASTELAFAYTMSQAELSEALDLTASATTATADGADISYSGAASACRNTPITLNVAGGAGYTWNWSPGTYLNTTVGPTVICTHTGLAPIVYTVTGTSPCNPVIVRTITVNPTAPATPPTAPNPSIFCGQSATIMATPSTGGTIDWWTAVSGGTQLADNSNSYITPVLAAGSYTYFMDEYTFSPGSGNGVLPYDESFEGATAATYTTTQNPIPGSGTSMNEWQYTPFSANARLRFGAAGVTPYTGGIRSMTLDRSAAGAATTGDAILTLNLAGYSTSTDMTLTFAYCKHGAVAASDFVVFARKNSGSAWTPIAGGAAATLWGASGAWTVSPTFDLDALLGVGFTSTFQLRFSVTSNNTVTGMTTNYGVSLDDIKIRGTENTPPSFCRSNRVPVTVTVNPLAMPVSPTGIYTSTICSGTSVTLTANSATGIPFNQVNWYNAAVGGTLLAGPSTTYTTPVLATGTYNYWAQENTPPGIDQTWNFAASLEGWAAAQACATSAGTWGWNSDGGVGTAMCANANSSSQTLTSPIIAVTGLSTVTLSYRHRLETEAGWDHGYVSYRLRTAGVWGAWIKFTPTTGAYMGVDGVFTDPYNACGTFNTDSYHGTAAYSTHSGNITIGAATDMQVEYFVSYDGSVTSGSWYLDWVRVNGGPAVACTSARRMYTVNVNTSPGNNNFCNAAAAFVGYNSFYSNFCANAQTSEPSTPNTCFRTNGGTNPGVSHSVWFRFTSPVTQTYGACIYYGTDPANTPTGGQFDSEMAMYTQTSGTCASNPNFTGAGPIVLAQVACNDDGSMVPAIHGPWGVRSAFNCGSITAGNTVFFQVDGAWRVAAGTKGNRMDAFPGASESNDFVLHIFPITLLDVDWVKFTGKRTDKGNLLEWVTANEYGTKEFEVQRSANGKGNFTTIGTVAAKGGINSSYTFVDENPLTRSYYRLREVGTDNKEHLSKVIILDKDASFGILSVSPNPARDVAEVQFTVEEASAVKLDLFDATGKLVLSSELNANPGVNANALNVAALAKGTYLLTLTDGKNKATSKLVKR